MRPMAISVGPALEPASDEPGDAVAALLRAAREHPASGVVSVSATDSVRRSYSELLDTARRVLSGLRGLGCRPGDPVVLHGLPLDDFFPAFWACVLGGFRPATIAEPPSESTADRFHHVCRLLDDPVVLDDARFARCRAADPAQDVHTPDPDDVALLMLSSGSTGLPKAVQLTHRGLAEFAASSRRVLDVRPEHVTLNWLPLDHSGAFLLYHVLAVFVGATNVHAPTDLVLGEPLRWLDLVERHRADHTWAPNFALRLVTDALDGTCEYDLSGLSTMVSGGEQVTVAVVDRFLAATGLPAERFRPAWGMAETTTAITFGRYSSGVHRVLKSSVSGDLEWVAEDTPDAVTFVSVGGPAPGAAVRVVDERGDVVPEGRIGRLQVRSARITPGYLGDEPTTAAAFPDMSRTGRTWFDSGDLAFLTGGEVVITGRAKDVIILNGHNYFCHEIEDVAAAVPGVGAGRVGACGVPDERTGSEELRVYVATDDPAPTALVSGVRAALFERLRISGARVVPVPVAEFPRTPAGKVRRAALRDRPVEPPRVPLAEVREVVAEVLGRAVDVDTPFYDLGMTSVALTRVRARLARALDRDIPATTLFRYPTVTALAAHLAGAAAPVEPAPAPVHDGRVAIIGMALRFPGASTVDEFWANLRDGVDSVRTFTAEEARAAGVSEDAVASAAFRPVAGALEDVSSFDGDFFGVNPREAELTDPAHRLFLECCHHALEHGGYAGAGARVGVYAGSGMNLYGHQDSRARVSADPVVAMQSSIGSTPDFLASRVAYRLGLTGPAIGVQTACSTSLVAVHLAAQAVLSGDADMALAGAAAVRVPQEAGYQHHPGSMLSPTGRLRAFDAAADGTVGGNGVAAVLLKPLAAALADGDTVHAVILGSAVNNDGTSKVGFAAPSVTGQVEVVRQALRRAGVSADAVSYVEAHGTGTPLGDPVEFDALCEAFDGAPAGGCALGSVKSNVGHLDSCAGMAGLIKVALMLRHRALVPTVHLGAPNPLLRLDGSPFTLARSHEPWPGEVLRAGVSALGVGGTNAHVILEEPPAPAIESPSAERALVPVSAVTPAALAALTEALRAHLTANPSLRPADVAATMALGRRHLPHRTALVGGGASWDEVSAPPGSAGPVAFVFAGQESVTAGMVAPLYEAFPAVRSVLDECEREVPGLLAQLLGEPVRDTQPVLFAAQAALVALWRSVGVVPECVAGHSLGEYAALHAAGALSLVDGLRLTVARGAAMASSPPGGMVALSASQSLATRIADDSGLELAAVNGPTTYVLSGTTEAVATAVRLTEEEGVACVRIDTGRGYHSALVEPALDALSARGVGPLRIPMVSGVDGVVLPVGHQVDVGYLRRQARLPVRYDKVVAALTPYGDVVEIGPGDVLTRLGRRMHPSAHWHPTMPDFLTAVGTRYRRGTTVNWSTLTMDGKRIPLPLYPFEKTRVGVPVEVAEVPVAEVCALTARLLGRPETDIDPDRKFVAHGADSLSLMNMTRELNDAFGVRVPVRQLFTDADTPRKVADLIGPRPVASPDPVAERDPVGPELTAPQEAPAEPDRAVVEVPDATSPAPTVTDAAPAPLPAAATAPSPATVGVTGPVPAPAHAGGQELRAVVDRQLAVAEQLVALMAGQLALLGGQAPAVPIATPATESAAPTAPVAAALPAASTTPTAPAPPAAPAAPAPPTAPSEPAAVTETPPPAPTGNRDFSLYFFGDYPDSEQADKYGLITAAAEFADQHNFHSLWLPERHFHSFGALFPNPSVLAAALASRTDRIRLNAGSVVLPLHHPVRVAEEWSVVDNLSGGRVGLCVASGWHATDFVLAPQNFGAHRELMYTQLDTVRRLWAGESVTATSGSGDDVEVTLHPRPVQTEPPLYVAVVGNPDSYRRAAENGLGIVTNLMAQSVDQLARNIALYRQTRAASGHGPGRVVVLVHTYLGADVDAVRQEAFAPFCAYLRSSLSLFDQVTTSLGVDIDLDDTPADDVEFLLGQAYARYCADRALIGTVDSSAPVVEQLLAAGADEIACFVDFGVAKEKVLDALPTLDTLRIRFQERHALTAAERRIWFLDRLYPGQTIYHEPKAIRLTGPLDTDRLASALQRVVDRQPALRTVFEDDHGEPRRVVRDRATVDCPVLESTSDDPIAAALATVPVFDLAEGPLLAARLVRVAPEEHLLVLVAHHIVFDSSSTAVFLRDLADYYRGVEPDPLPAATGRPEPVDDNALDYWRRQLADAPTLRLPTDHPRPATRSGRGAALTYDLDADLVGGLRDATDGTVFMAVLAAVAAVLGRFAGQDDLVLGTAVASRPSDAADRVGLFLDTVALRVDLTGDPDFTTLAGRILGTTADALEHRGVPFDELVGAINPDRDPGRNPLFQVMVEFENETTVDFDPPRLTATAIDVPADRAPFDLSLYLTQHPGGLHVSVEYDADLFVADTVLRILTHLEHVLRRAVADPAAPLSALTAATDADRADLARWQGIPASGTACLHELVERQVDRTPDAVAMLAGDHELTYRELDERANQVANALLANGIGRGDRVAVRLPRGPELIAALLGVLKSGAAYVPLDPALPAARVDLLVADSGAKPLPDSVNAPTTRPNVAVDPEDIAYCIYTSGSTGRPKGVLVPHRGPTNVVAWQTRQHAPLRTLQWTSPAFDVSVQEIVSTLAAGAALVLVDDDVRYDPAAVVEVARTHGVERIFMPYTPLKYLMETRPNLPALRMIASAGEPLVLTPALRDFLAEHPECLLYNQYGPTEGSIIVTSHRVDPAAGATPPIGAPIDGVTVRLLDEHGEPVPVGAVGELHIGGVAAAVGYLGQPPFADGYRTGDLGRWRADGTIEFLGRRDDQVKIRGYRVEPAEAERAVAELPEVRDAAVVVRTDTGEPELVAYVVLDGEVTTLAARLRAVLPNYLVPQRWVALERLPVNASGKLDRSRLPAPGAGEAGAVPATALERALHDLWCAELGRDSVPVDRSFFALGGHSLSAVRLLNRVTALGLTCSMTDFFRDPTIRALAAREVVDRVPLTSVQQRLWRRHHERANPAVYNVAHRIDLTGDLDPEALRRAVEALVHRHDALRSRLSEVDRAVLAPFPVPLPVEEDMSDVDEWCAAIAREPFALTEAPLFRFRLGRVGPGRWVFVVVLHHAVCDGVSLGTVWEELSALYAGRELSPAAQYVPSEPAPARRAELVRYWRSELSDVDLFPRLPSDRPRPATLSGEGGLYRATLPAELAEGIATAATSLGGTPYSVLATGFARWLAGRLGREEVVLAASSANRTRPEDDGVVGLIGDAVLVRVSSPRVREFSERLYAALDHQELPLTEVVRNVAPELVDGLYPTVLFTVVTTPPPALALEGVTSEVRAVAVPGLARTELYVRVVADAAETTVYWEYSTDLFDEPTIAAWHGELRTTLAELVRTRPDELAA